MESTEKDQMLRPWVFFLLIILTALLWATFLLTRGEMLSVSLALALIATLMSTFAFTFTRKLRPYLYLNLTIFAAVIWATFLLVQGSMIIVSLFLYTVAGCVNIFAFLWVEEEGRE